VHHEAGRAGMYKDEASFNISTAEGGVYSHAGNWLIKELA
jgi:hypothetical protein